MTFAAAATAGFAALGSFTAGVTFALAMVALATLCLIVVIWQERPRRTQSVETVTTG
ncbi:hypothetical protein HNP40_002298 [Mycobacteroides chelonae]|nr:hypothetical protein [Mycobacteroides chelonae]